MGAGKNRNTGVWIVLTGTDMVTVESSEIKALRTAVKGEGHAFFLKYGESFNTMNAVNRGVRTNHDDLPTTDGEFDLDSMALEAVKNFAKEMQE